MLSSRGPVVSGEEIKQARSRLDAYFRSEHFLQFANLFPLGKIKVSVSLYGSLVTGVASKYSQYNGLPSDYGRVSDVDMGIVIDTNSIDKIKFEGRCLFKKGIYYGPFNEDAATNLGPFMKIFEFLRGLSFAKRTDRKVGFVIVDENFYNANLSKNEHVVLFEDEIYLR